MIATFNQEGTLPQEGSFVDVGADNVMLDVIKRAEDPNCNALVLHFSERHNKDTETQVRIGERIVDVHLRPNGLTSVMLPLDSRLPVFETDAAELKGFSTNDKIQRAYRRIR